MARRNIVLATDYVYHITNRGIAKREIFNNKYDYQRFFQLIAYHYQDPPMRFSHYLSLDEEKTQAYLSRLNAKHYVDILAFALLPNHFHLLLRQNKKDGISNFVSRIENSYVRYFNTKNSRKGPLFEASFYAGLVEDDEQFRKRI